MAALVQSKSAATSGAQQTVSITFDSPPTEGDLIVAVLWLTGADLTAPTPTNYTEVPLGWNDADLDRPLFIFYRVAGASESSTITIDLGAGTTRHMTLYGGEYSGLHNVQNEVLGSYINGTSLPNGSTAETEAWTGYLPHTDTDGELVVAAIGIAGTTGGYTAAWSNGFTNRAAVETSGAGAKAALTVADRTDVPLLESDQVNTGRSWTNSLGAVAAICSFRTAAPPSRSLDWAWVGNQSATGVTIATKTPAASDVQIEYATNSALSGSTTTTAETADADGLAKTELSGLTADTEYFYRVVIDATPDLFVRRFTTAPVAEQAASFKFAHASCAKYNPTFQTPSIHVNFDRIREEGVLFFLHTGDLHYADEDSTDPDDHLAHRNAVLESPRQSGFFSNLAVPYMWDDHDYAGNNGNASSTGRDAAVEAYRQQVPSYPLVESGSTDAIYHAYTIGRVRFLILDVRSMRTGSSFLGTAQQQWVKDELTAFAANADLGLVVIESGVPWIATATGGDDWSQGNGPTARTDICDHIGSLGIADQVCFIAGDMHGLAIDDGTNNTFDTAGTGPGSPVFQAGAINQNGSTKGGPYSEGTYPNASGTGSSLLDGQYGLFEVADDGSTITVDWTGYRVWGSGGKDELVAYQFAVDAPSPPPSGGSNRMGGNRAIRKPPR